VFAVTFTPDEVSVCQPVSVSFVKVESNSSRYPTEAAVCVPVLPAPCRSGCR